MAGVIVMSLELIGPKCGEMVGALGSNISKGHIKPSRVTSHPLF